MKMKKLPLALTAVTALSGSALAADLPARIYTKAPPPAIVAPNWTGFYVFGGGGSGIWNADSNVNDTVLGDFTRDEHMGGHGLFGTVGAGYDWRVDRSWVAGIFADAMFGSLSGSISDPIFRDQGAEKLRTTWAAGVFADGMFGSLKGSLSDQDFGVEGAEKLRTTWGAGARVGFPRGRSARSPRHPYRSQSHRVGPAFTCSAAAAMAFGVRRAKSYPSWTAPL
jgi:opacity protein-like surface antigen